MCHCAERFSPVKAQEMRFMMCMAVIQASCTPHAGHLLKDMIIMTRS